MRLGRHATRVSRLVLAACVISTGGAVLGAGAGARVSAAKDSGSNVQIEYKGNFVSTGISQVNQGQVIKRVSAVQWDFVWSGTVDQLFYPIKYGLPSGNVLVPRLLTGSTIVAYPPNEPGSCTGALSLRKFAQASNGAASIPTALALNGVPDVDRSKIDLGFVIPESGLILQSSGTGDCSAGSYSSGAADSLNIKRPQPVFSLTNLGVTQTKSYNGTERTATSGEVDTTTIRSTVMFGGAACTGSSSAGGSSGLAALFGCYVALGDSYSAGQTPSSPGTTSALPRATSSRWML